MDPLALNDIEIRHGLQGKEKRSSTFSQQTDVAGLSAFINMFNYKIKKMKTRITIFLFAILAIFSMDSCRGKAAVKAAEAAEKAFQKAPKKTTTIKGGALLESGKYADDVARIADEVSEEDAYSEDESDF